MLEGILTNVGKRRVVKILSKHMNIIYDRGWYWKVDWTRMSQYSASKLVKTKPADEYAEVLTIVEDGKFMTLINFEDFNTYSIIEGLTDTPDGVYKELPEIKIMKKSELYRHLGKIMKIKDDGEAPAITDYVPDVYNRIYGHWKVRSYLGDEEDIVEIIYNDYQEVAYNIIYKKDLTIVLSPVASFLIHHPLGPKIIDLAKNATIKKWGYYGFGLWKAVQKNAEWVNELLDLLTKHDNGEVDTDEVDDETIRVAERIANSFKTKITLEPLSNSAAAEDGLYTLFTFLDGVKPVYASPFGFYAGDPKDFKPEKAVRKLDALIGPTHYSKGDFELKIFDDLTYAVRYGNYLALPCCLIKLNAPVELEDVQSPEQAAAEAVRTGYKYATKDPRKYTMRMKFDVPDFEL